MFVKSTLKCSHKESCALEIDCVQFNNKRERLEICRSGEKSLSLLGDRLIKLNQVNKKYKNKMKNKWDFIKFAVSL
jgi:hypothetical protein